jgi:hypothetical protein
MMPARKQIDYHQPEQKSQQLFSDQGTLFRKLRALNQRLTGCSVFNGLLQAAVNKTISL